MYKLIIEPKAQDFYKRLYLADRSHFLRIAEAFETLKEYPFRGKPLKLSLKEKFSLKMAQIIAGITGVATVGGIGINIYQVYKQKQDDKIKRVVEIERIDGKFNEIKTLLQASNMVNRAETRQMISEHSSDEKLFNIGIGLGTVVGSGVIAALINKYLS